MRLAAATSVVALTLLPGSPARAEVAQVSGGAFGFETAVSLFGGPENRRGPIPTVTLPAGGSNAPITASEPSGSAQFGPATIIEAGQMRVSTEGRTGPDGLAKSSATVAGVQDGPGPFLFQEVASTCEARESGASGSATIRGGKLETKYNQEEEPINTEEVPSNPAPNFERTGTLDHVGDSYRIVFNEQIRQAGGITVNAVHMYLLGPTAKGELIIGQSRCATNAGAAGGGAGGGPGSTPTTAGGGGSAGGSSGGGSAGGGSGTAGGGANMPKTGLDVLPLTIVGSEMVAGGAAAVLWARRHRRWPRH